MATDQRESESAPRGLAKADLPQLCDQETIQCAEKNPRTPAPGISLAQAVHADATEMRMPVVPVNDIPQPFSQSSWACRNARAKRLSGYIPGPIRGLLIILLVFLAWVWWMFVVAGAVFTLPGLFTMLIGNAICEAANLPHFTRIEATIAVGAIGGCFGTLIAIFFVMPVAFLGDWMEKRFKERYRRSGRIPRDSTREDGHFPVLLLWIPLVFLACFLAGPFGDTVSSAIPGVGGLSSVDLTIMSAIGGVFVAPVWMVVTPLTCGVLESIYHFLYEVLQGCARKKEPTIAPYLWRQSEAFVWLLTPAPRQTLSGTGIGATGV